MAEVTPVSSKRDQKAFTEFPWRHYDGDPNWMPMLKDFERELLNYKKHPFYQNAQIQTFLATQNGQVVGRIAGIVDHLHNARFEEKRGMFGFFESIDDQTVAHQLFTAAEGWMRDQGMDCARGPNSPSLNHQFTGCLVDAFDKPPTFMMPYNKPYYGSLIENEGYEKSQDLYAFWGHMDMLQTLDKKLVFIIEEVKKRFDNMTIRRGKTGRRLKEDVQAFVRLYNAGLAAQWGFVPMSDAEVKHVADSLSLLIVPEMTTVIEINGSPVAVTFGMLDYNPLIKKIKGKLFPFGALRLLFGRKSIKKVRLIGTYVTPEYQKWGLGLVLMSRLVPDLIAWGIEETEFSYVLESNHLSRKTLERGGAVRERTYRLYDKQLS